MQEFDKQYYKIKEVAEILDVAQSAIRFWEKEFPTLVKPTRNAHNIRYYRPQDIEKLRIIKYLIKEKGLKIEAARDYLRSNPQNTSKRLEVIDELTLIRTQLADLLRAMGGRKM